MNYLNNTQVNQKWLRTNEAVRLPVASTEITESGMYRIASDSLVRMIVSDSAITEFPYNYNSQVQFNGQYYGPYDVYLHKGQFIRSSTTSGTYTLLS